MSVEWLRGVITLRLGITTFLLVSIAAQIANCGSPADAPRPNELDAIGNSASSPITLPDHEDDLTELARDNGGWRYPGEVPVTDNGRCTIERVDGATFTQKDFVEKYAYRQPVIIYGIDNRRFQHLTQRKVMLTNWAQLPVVLNSANTFSYKRVPATFEEYVSRYLRPQNLTVLGNETLYLFGDIDPEVWNPLLSEYRLPAWTVPGHEPALSFGIAGAGTGVPFHFHGPGFAEVIFGSKRWFLTPHERRPKFNPDKSSLDWYLNEYPKLDADERPLECLMRPGELIYFPDKWYHATLNMETSVFISTFLSPAKRVKKKQEL